MFIPIRKKFIRPSDLNPDLTERIILAQLTIKGLRRLVLEISLNQTGLSGRYLVYNDEGVCVMSTKDIPAAFARYSDLNKAEAITNIEKLA